MISMVIMKGMVRQLPQRLQAKWSYYEPSNNITRIILIIVIVVVVIVIVNVVIIMIIRLVMIMIIKMTKFMRSLQQL